MKQFCKNIIKLINFLETFFYKRNSEKNLEKIVIYTYFTGKVKEFYFTKGSIDQFYQQNIESVAREVL